MPTINVKPDSAQELQEIADTLGKSKKVIVVTGAGISTNCGIPDFRSENGLYSMIQAQYDAALQNPPWETKDDFDIDDRPKKKRRRWYYEVVKADGEVVQVIDEDVEKVEVPLQRATPRPSSSSSSSQQQLSENTTTTCSSPLSSPPPSLPSSSQSTAASSVASTRSQSPVQSSQPQNDSSQASRQELPNLKGKDLFDCMVWKDPFTTSIFYMFISKFRQTIYEEVKHPSPTHHLIKTLRDAGRLVRNYTQNIDCLEERMGLRSELGLGPGNKARFSTRNQRRPRLSVDERDSAHDGGVEVVQLHGSIVDLRCGICGKCCAWDETRQSATLSGYAPDCPSCVEASQQRAGKGRRGLAVGRLRPDIVLYGEEHPSASLVAPLITHDLALGPDVLLILGTSLRVHGLKVMVKEFAKAVHNRGGKVVFVNRTKPPESIWGDVIDYWVGWDCDEWVLDLKERRNDLWLPRGSISEEKRIKKESSDGKVKKEVPAGAAERKNPVRPQAVRDCKMNGVYHTFKIMDLLAKLKDQDGNVADRPMMWDRPNRRSTTSKAELRTQSSSSTGVKQPSIAERPIFNKRKSAPSALSSVNTANTSKPRQPRASFQDAKQSTAPRTPSYWEQTLEHAPTLRKTPPKSGFIHSNVLIANAHPDIKQWYGIDPTELQKTLADRKLPMPDLISHPPSGDNITPKHTYGTRAQRQIFIANDTFRPPILPGLSPRSSIPSYISPGAILPPPTPQGLNFPKPTPHDSSPSVLSSGPSRIKDRGSISSIISSPLSSPLGSSVLPNEKFHDAKES